MPRIDFQYKRIPADVSTYGKGFALNSLSKSDFESFNTSVLGLGDVSKDGKYIQAIAVFYDLEGFTSFSNQVDSHLVIPEFLKRYLDWLFASLAECFKEGEKDDLVRIWGALPFHAKFLGDGILFLWDSEHIQGPRAQSNIIIQLHRISLKYQNEFLAEIRKHVSNPPSRLRCGVARGQIISIGGGNDYVGSCINIASRLQKLSRLSFAVSRRGIDLDSISQPYWKNIILKKVELRGIGKEELVYVNKSEYETLPSAERKLFKDP